jgi:DHA1 family multidrug resistance protein-like MFS transporter
VTHNNDAHDVLLRRAFAAMLGVQFILAAAFSIVPPVIPLLLPDLGVIDAGAISTWSGVLLGVTPLTAGLMAPVWGRVVDRVDRRKIILMACVAAGISALLMSVTTAPWQLLTLRASMGFFGGHIVAVMALVTSICPPPRLGWALGWLSTAQLAGMLLGPLIGGVIADALHSYRSPFVAGGCASLIVALVVLRLPKQPAANHSSSLPRQPTGKILSRYPSLRTMVLVLLLAQLAMTSAQPIVSLYVSDLVGPVSNLATLAGVAFSVIGISGLLAAPLIGRAGDRVGRQQLLTGVLCGAAILTFVQAFALTYRWFVVERFAAGLFLAGVVPLANSLVAQTVHPQDRGRAFGLTGSATFLGAFLGPFGGGILNARFDVSRVFESASAALLVAAALVYTSMRRAPQPPARIT